MLYNIDNQSSTFELFCDEGHETAYESQLANAAKRDIEPINSTHSKTIKPAASKLEKLDALDFLNEHAASFPLLSKEEELEIANNLNRSSHALALQCLHCPVRRTYLVHLIEFSVSHSLKKRDFSSDDYYFALRRELDDLNSTENTTTLQSLLNALQDQKNSQEMLELSHQIDWPGPLMLAVGKPESNTLLSEAINKHLWQQLRVPFSYPLNNDEQHLFKRYSRLWLTYREKLVNHNLRLVFHITKNYTNPNSKYASRMTDHLPDLLQEGLLGLMRAAEKYRPASGCRFSTYAHQWIESKIRKARSNIDKLMPLSQESNNSLLKVSQALDDISADNHQTVRYPSNELFEKLNFSKTQSHWLKHLKSHRLSLDDHEEDELSLAEKLPCPNDLIDDVTQQSEANYVDKLMNEVLNDRERYIINERYGRLNDDSKTLQELSGIMGLSRERIRQLETSGLEKLKAVLKEHYFH